MTVYVDDMRAPFGTKRPMIMCHMIADTEAELHAMAARIGVSRHWYQGDHYDVALSKRRLAVRAGRARDHMARTFHNGARAQARRADDAAGERIAGATGVAAMNLTADTFPHLHAAFRAIEIDNGGHLIGTVYPGKRIDLDSFFVPPAWEPLLPLAEAALARLRAASESEFETFVCGEQSEQEAIAARQGAIAQLAVAHTVLDDWFNGWPPEDAPTATSQVEVLKRLRDVDTPAAPDQPARDAGVAAATAILFCHAQWGGDDYTAHRVAIDMLDAARKARAETSQGETST